MMTIRGWQRAAAVVLGLSALLAPAVAPASAATAPVAQYRTMPEPPPEYEIRTELDKLTVQEPSTTPAYNRKYFRHWITQYGKCSTRDVTLSRDGQGVTLDSGCKATAGTWYSPYDDTTLDRASRVDIDHMVPLANAWESGANAWDDKEREKFANDLTNPQLIAVSDKSNRSKGRKSPDQWAPPNEDFWCTYSKAWTNVKYIYKLSVTEPEKKKLSAMLDTCD
jgi:hypothetical protein